MRSKGNEVKEPQWYARRFRREATEPPTAPSGAVAGSGGAS
jgi:hypothetical protein